MVRFLIIGICFLINLSLISQEYAPALTHEMTPEEELRKNEIGLAFTPSDPPLPPARTIAEFEAMEGVLIRYPFGIPMSLIVEMAEDCMVKTIVSGNSQKNTVLSQYIANGVDTSHCEWLIAPTNSYWTRDYGPWFVGDGNQEMGICDFPYNRPRPSDDNIPVVLAQQMGVPLFGMNLIHTGGNWMCDGMGIASSTELIWTENPSLSHMQVDSLVNDYLGIETYHVLPDPLDDYIQHIDCWGKFLDVDKVLIGQVSPSDYRYADYEYVANYFAGQVSSYGTPFQVSRVFTPGTYPYTPYTNSLILNNKVFVPQTGSQWDDEAISVYQSSMPGYEIIGVPYSGWQNTDALHCRVIGIADTGMLYIHHIPILGNQDFSLNYEVFADFISYTGAGIVNESPKCFFKVDEGDFQYIPLQFQYGNRYKAVLPYIEPGSVVSYYIQASDSSGRTANHPFIGEPDPHSFTVGTTISNVAGYWTGAASSSWNTASNWSDNNIPLLSTRIFIPADADHWPEFTGDLTIGITCGNIIVDESAQFTVTGSISINAGFSLQIMNNGVVYQNMSDN